MQQLAQNQLDFLRPIFVKAMLIMGFSVKSRPTLEDMKKRYRRLALRHHPDKGGDESKMKEITEAYGLLTGRTKVRIPPPVIQRQIAWVQIYTCSATNTCATMRNLFVLI